MTLRIGTLGAARITPMALIRPARQVAGVEVVAVAARDRERATRFARKHGIGRIHDSYRSLLDDPDVDAVYNPLPNGLHGTWTLAALAAGKHVLCEKPFAANAAEAAAVAEASRESDRVVMEALHWRYHPLAHRAVELVRSGALGEIRQVSATMAVPIPLPRDIRYDLRLAGGAEMDVGAYTTHLVRSLGVGEPEVTSARARLARPGVDRRMESELAYPGGATATTLGSMWSRRLLDIRARVVGSEAELRIINPVAPHVFHRFEIRGPHRTVRERFGRVPTYVHQLMAFRDAVLEGGPVITDIDDAVANMAVIDATYAAAGLAPRQPTT